MDSWKKSILVVDDHTMFLDGLTEIIGKLEYYEVKGRAVTASQAQEFLINDSVDIVISDVRMPEMGGYELSKWIKENYPQIKVLIVSMHNDPLTINELLQAGVSGYILKNTGKEELQQALDKISTGETFFSEEVKSSYIQSKVVGTPFYHGKISLTKREREVLKLIAAEYTTNEMAEKLFISLNTVESHRKNILRKLDAKNSVGLVKKAMSLGLLD